MRETMSRNPEYQRFENLSRRLVNVSHDELKAKLQAYKKAKASKPKAPKESTVAITMLK